MSFRNLNQYGTKFKYQRVFAFVQIWWHVSVSCFNSFVFINEDQRFPQSRMLSTFYHTHGSYSNMFCPPASTTEWSFSRKALSLTSQAWNYNSQQPRPTLSLLYFAGSIRISIPMTETCVYASVNILTCSGSVLFVCICTCI